MYQNTHDDVISVTVTARRPLPLQSWRCNAGCPKQRAAKGIKAQHSACAGMMWARRRATCRQDCPRWGPAPLESRVLLRSCADVQRHTRNLPFPPPYCAYGILQAQRVFAPQSIPDLIGLGEMWKLNFVLIPDVAGNIAFLSIPILAVFPGVICSAWHERESPGSCLKVNCEPCQGD